MNSLKSKITASTLAIFLIGLWSLSFYTSSMLQKDMEQLLGEQQVSIVSRLASEVNRELEERMQDLEAVAAGITPAMLGNTATMQTRLEERPVFQKHFNGGIYTTRLDGTATASVPLALGRLGTNYMDRDHVAAALKGGKTAISKLVIGKKLHAPVFSIATPIRGPGGSVIGALVGVIDLGQPNFLDRVTASRYGKSGGFMVISANERRVITASDKSRIMEQLPAAGVNPAIDRFLGGYEGFALMVNPAGVEMLAADMGIPAAGWIAALVLPAAEAFAPVRAMQWRLLLASTLLTLLASAITWWILRRHLTPLIATAKTMATMADRNQPLHPLPVFKHDEIGQLTSGFNRLIETVARREEALSASDETLRSILATTLDGYWCLGPDGKLLDVNPTYSQQSGYTREELLSMHIADLEASEHSPDTERHIQRILQQGHDQFESTHRRKDGSIWSVEVSTVYSPVNGGQMFAFLRDITERKNTQEKLVQNEKRMTSILEGAADAIYIVNPQGNYQYVNQEATRLLGYSREEMLGMNISDIARSEDVAEVHKQFESLLHTGSLRMEYWLTTKSGSTVPVELNATRLPDGNIFGSCRDIAQRKQAEASLHLAASVFTHAREGIMITAADGTIIDVNDTFTRITGYERADVLGQNPRILSSGRQNTGFYATLWSDLKEQGHWSGEIWNRRKNGEVYAEMQTIGAVRDALGRTQQYVALFSDITPLKEQQRQLEHIAHYDALTGLPNRVLLADRLHQSMAQAQRRGQQLAVTYLDLDGFKTINDHHGHDAGDQLLIALASRLKQVMRNGDTLARMGGDEFVVVLVDLADVAASVPVLARLLAAAAQPVLVGDAMLQVSASLGVTFYPQTEEVDADQLLRQADQAMYQAKLAGKHRYHVFDADQDRTVRGHHEDLDRMRQALAAQEFVLYYQPKVNMRLGVVIGAEALIRWQHPDKGLLPPAMFLPAIENDPLAIELGEWVIHTALAQMEVWHGAGLMIPISVNVGARQLQQEGFPERLRELLAQHPGVHPGDLELEVLETSALEDLAQVSAVMEVCRAMGVQFALDDFGTGYSSLTYLKRLPVTLLKIDQSFVRDMLDDPDDLSILDGVIGLAEAFRREVIAEGVETVEHGEMLLQLGCDQAQGYGIARPMPAQALPDWAATWKPDPMWHDVPMASRTDLPLLFACVEHRAWIKSMGSYLRDQRNTPPPLDHHQCPFGLWMESQGVTRYGTNASFASVETLHLQVHGLAAELHAVKARGQGEEALARLGELQTLANALLQQLKGMMQAPSNPSPSAHGLQWALEDSAR